MKTPDMRNIEKQSSDKLRSFDSNYRENSNNFNSQFKAILVAFPTLYKPPFRVRSGEVALNCPVLSMRHDSADAGAPLQIAVICIWILLLLMTNIGAARDLGRLSGQALKHSYELLILAGLTNSAGPTRRILSSAEFWELTGATLQHLVKTSRLASVHGVGEPWTKM